jgi:hypothetical protein
LQNIFKAYEEMKVLASTITDEELMELSEVNDNVRYVMNKRTLNYAFSNVKEFVAYMYSDPTFKKIIENLGTKLAYKTKAQEPQTFTAKFVNNLKKWFKDLLEFLLGRQLVFTKDREEYTSVLGSMKNLYSISLYSSRIRKDANEVAALLDKTKDGKDYLIETRDDDEVDEGGEDTDEEATAAEKDDSRNEQTESLNKIISSDNVDGVMLQSDTDEGKYQDKNGNLYNRLTEFVSNIFFSSMSGKVREPEYYATKDFSDRGVPITEKISKKVDNGKEQLFTYDELVEYHKRKSNNYKTWGKAAHAFIELLLTQDEAKKKEIEARLQELVKPRFDEDGRQISDPVDLSAMQWLTGMDRNVEISLQQILTAAGITLNLKNQKFNKSLQSISLPELAIVLPGLDVGTTIDNLFIDADGTYSILDWKTGALLSDFNNPEIMK